MLLPAVPADLNLFCTHSITLLEPLLHQEKGICFDFLKGLCTRGLLCRFSHDLRNLQAQAVTVSSVVRMFGVTRLARDTLLQAAAHLLADMPCCQCILLPAEQCALDVASSHATPLPCPHPKYSLRLPRSALRPSATIL